MIQQVDTRKNSWWIYKWSLNISWSILDRIAYGPHLFPFFFLHLLSRSSFSLSSPSRVGFSSVSIFQKIRYDEEDSRLNLIHTQLETYHKAFITYFTQFGWQLSRLWVDIKFKHQTEIWYHFMASRMCNLREPETNCAHPKFRKWA